MCTRCDPGAPENAVHMVMQCPANVSHRDHLSNEITDICPDIEPQEFLGVVLEIGKEIDGMAFIQMRPIWEISAKHVSYMYYDTLKARTGVG